MEYEGPDKIELALKTIKENLHVLSTEEKFRALELVQRHNILRARKNFYGFVELMVEMFIPNDYVSGAHIKYLCDVLQKVEHDTANFRPRRVQISIAPNSMKTVLMNLFVAWCFGRHPNWRVIHVGHSISLIKNVMGGPIRDLMRTPEYQAIFPDLELKKDRRANADWETTRKGAYFGAGVGAQIAGRRATLGIVDDAMSEQTAFSKTERDKINNWYVPGFRTRLSRMPPGSEVVIATRWHVNDLSGFLQTLDGTEDNPKKGSKFPWKVIAIPAVLDEKWAETLGLEVGGSYWPAYKPLEALEEERRSNTEQHWSALYMQSPIVESGNIFKVNHFRPWTGADPPQGIYYVLMSLDTAFSTKAGADFSAYQVWGLFDKLIVHPKTHREIKVPHMILLDSEKGRWDFPTLCDKVQSVFEMTEPDVVLIEAQGSGHSLTQELIRRGIPVQTYRTSNDKITRAHAVTPIMAAGRILVPFEGERPRRFCQSLVSECLAFPNAPNDDECFTPDSCVTVTTNGIIKSMKIEDISVGDTVLTPQGNSKKVVRVYKNQAANGLVNIKAAGKMPVRCTPNHPFLALKTDWKGQAFKKETAYANALVEGKFQWLPASELKKGDILLERIDRRIVEGPILDLKDFVPKEEQDKTKFSPITKKQVSGFDFDDENVWLINPRATKVKRFVDTNDPDFGRLIGYYLSEGSCGKHNVTFSFHKDETQNQEDVVYLLNKLFGLKAHKTVFENAARINVSSKILRWFFKSLIPGRASEKQIPSFLLTAPLDVQKELVKGLYFGDGSLKGKHGICYATSSEKLAFDLNYVLNRFDVPQTLSVTRKDGSFVTFKNKTKNYEAKPLYLLKVCPNYQQKMCDAFGFTNPVSDNRKVKGSIWVNGDFVWRTVRYTADEPYDGLVYNLEVEDDHTYLVNGLAVHNCDALTQAVLWMRDSYSMSNPRYKDEEEDLGDGPSDLPLDGSGRGTYWSKLTSQAA